jgi:hypothetical protein
MAAAALGGGIRFPTLCDHSKVTTYGKNIHRCDACARWWTTPFPVAAPVTEATP